MDQRERRDWVYLSFDKLGEEKRQRIINAAFEEFAAYGFDRASTNRIVEQAGISKGALYHYFGSKEKLFLYLCGYAGKVIEEHYYGNIPLNEKDLLVRYECAFQQKLRLYREYPKLFDFMKALVAEQSEKVILPVKEQISRLMEKGYGCLTEGVDETLFVSGGSFEQMRNLVVWTVEGYANRVMAGVDWKKIDAEWIGEMQKEFYSYLRLLRTCLYQDQGIESGFEGKQLDGRQ